jgi:hypothetical protein
MRKRMKKLNAMDSSFNPHGWFKACWLLIALALTFPALASRYAMVGDFTGESKGVSSGVLLGLQAALRDDPDVELVTYNHVFRPAKAVDEVEAAVATGPVAFVANTDTASLSATLAAMNKSGLPLIGFVSGADFLYESPALVSIRPSFHQEADFLVSQAVSHGLKPGEICAFIQNDEHGLAGLRAIRDALAKHEGSEQQVEGIDRVLGVKGRSSSRNMVGPVGTYKRYTLVSRDGYESIKRWENVTGQRCKMIMTSGVYTSISKFISYSRYKGEGWVVAVFSTVGMETLQQSFSEFKVDDQVTRRVVMTQPMPVFDFSLPVVREAVQTLKEEYGSQTLEGFLIGRLVQKLAEISRTEGIPLAEAARGRVMDLGGWTLDFTEGNQGREKISLVTMEDGAWRPVDEESWRTWVQ